MTQEHHESSVSTTIYILKIIMIDVVALAVVVSQLVILFIKTRRKAIAVKKMHGYSFMKRYEDLFLLQIAFYVIVFFSLYMVRQSIDIMQSVIIIMLFEFLLTSIIIYIAEKKIIITSLKEGS